MIDPKKILVLAPHTDDAELGCGATLAKFCAERKDVHYVAFSTCKKSLPAGLAEDTLEKECRAATKELGLHPGKLLFYDFEVRCFAQKKQEIIIRIMA